MFNGASPLRPDRADRLRPAVAATWHIATASARPAFRVTFAAEIVAAAAGVVLTVVLVRACRWAEAVHVGTQLAVLACSTLFYSVTRATLLWWPLWLLLAGAAARRPWVRAVYLALAPPLAATVTLGFVTGHWVG